MADQPSLQQPPSAENIPKAQILSGEWLETDGLGGYASGSVGWGRTRRQHALYAWGRGPELRRRSLLASVDIWVELGGEVFALSSQCYAGGFAWPDINPTLKRFQLEPWPTWSFDCLGLPVAVEIFMRYGQPVVAIAVKFDQKTSGGARVIYKPYLALRSVHAVRNASAAKQPEHKKEGWIWHWMEPDHPEGIAIACQGDFEAQPEWCGPFYYARDAELLQDSEEILYSPGVFICNLGPDPAPLLATNTSDAEKCFPDTKTPFEIYQSLQEAELQRRTERMGVLVRAMECYVVRDQSGPHIISGYPWLGEDIRDTLMALRGLCLTPGFLRDALAILLRTSEHLREISLQKIFSSKTHLSTSWDLADVPLWFIISSWEVISCYQLNRLWLSEADELQLRTIAAELVRLYSQGIHPSVRMDEDGLLVCEKSSVAWDIWSLEDARQASSRGKFLSLQILWLNALWVVSRRDRTFTELHELAQRSFEQKFWDDNLGILKDAIETTRPPDSEIPAFRGEQILAVGGLPKTVLRRDRASRLLEAVEEHLLTPVGLRSLLPQHPKYTPNLEGDIFSRASAFSNGAVWPWLIGPYVDAWVRVRGSGDEVKTEARQRFLSLVGKNIYQGGLGHLPELCDGEPPHTPRGCPFHVRALVEVIRLREWVLKRSEEIPHDEGPILRIKAKGFEI